MAVLGLRCCTGAFSSCSEQGQLSSCGVQWVTSLVAEHGLYSTWLSVAEAPRLWQAQQLWCLGLAAPWARGSSQTKTNPCLLLCMDSSSALSQEEASSTLSPMVNYHIWAISLEMKGALLTWTERHHTLFWRVSGGFHSTFPPGSRSSSLIPLLAPTWQESFLPGSGIFRPVLQSLLPPLSMSQLSEVHSYTQSPSVTANKSHPLPWKLLQRL